MRKLLNLPLLFLLVLLGHCTDTAAQVSVRYSPEPMAVPQSVLANARDLGRWQIQLCNDGPGVSIIPSERVSMAAGAVSFLTPDAALLVLSGHARRSAASKVVIALGWAGKAAAIALVIASRANYSWSTGIGIGSSVIPDVLELARGTVPDPGPLISPVRWPVMLTPSQCLTDHWFAGKMRQPVPFTAVLKP